MLSRREFSRQGGNAKGFDMPKTKGKRQPLVRTQRAKKVRPGAPLLETRARSILSTMVTEVAAEPTEGASDLRLPEPPAPVPVEASDAQFGSPLDDLPADDLAEIARQGASLELDGSRYEAVELVSLAQSMQDEAHLRISNSGTFTAKELALIARATSGQVIFA